MKRRIVCALWAVILVVLTPAAVYAARNVKIKLTGTANEKITMTVGNTGRTEVIYDLPFEFEVPKYQMPVRLTFQSENYIYYNIDVPRKPFDTTGHIYLVKINENAMTVRNNAAVQPHEQYAQERPSTSVPVPRLDMTKGINVAPVTGMKNENTFVLIIANEKYDMAAEVDNAINDGLVFKEYCVKTLGIPAQNVKYHTNLTFGKMRKALNDIIDITNVVGSEANLIIYYAGHGIPDNKTKNAFLMPTDSDGADTEVCFSLGDFYDKLNATSARQCIVFLDACFSGAQRDGDMIMAARGVKLKPRQTAPKGNTIVFSATSGEEAAYSYKEENHGLFTYFLLKKLQETKGKTSLGELADYLKKNVGIQSRLINNNPQTPTVAVSPSISNDWRSFMLAK